MSTPAWISSLPSGVVASDLTADAATGVFNYADALQLIVDVENAGAVTASEFSALQTVAANLNNGLTTSAYVASVFTQLVDGSAANANWTGGATTTIPLGNLMAGTSVQDLTYLEGQWLLGTNLPNPTTPAGSGSFQISAYGAITAPLYGSSGAAAIGDICQGGEGDCEVMASLIGMVQNHPQSLASMIVANPNGTYGVRFFVDGNEVWETVNDQFPIFQDALGYAHNPNFQNTALWVPLVEKAYAQLSATGLIGQAASIDSYENIDGDNATYVLSNVADASATNYYNYADANYNSEKQWYIDAFASGDDVFVETGSDNADNTVDGSGNTEFIDDHAFVVVGYDSATGDFILRNPWGGGVTGQTWDAQFEASLSQIAAVQGDFAIDNTGTDGSKMRVVVTAPNTGLTESVVNYPLAGSLSGQIVAGVATPLAGFFKIADSTGAAVSEYNLQLLGGGTIALNGAANLANVAQTAAGQIVVSAADLSKITFSAAAGAGQQDLLVSGYDGKAWSATADIQLQVAAAGTAIINPNLGALVAAGAAVSVSSLFTTGGAAATDYAFIVPTGAGSIDLNGATNDWGAQTPGSTGYQVAADQVSLLTYVAPATGGAQTLQGQVYNGSNWSAWQDVQVGVGVSVTAALTDYANGQLGTGAAIVDTAVNIFANLDALQSALAAGELTALGATNTTLQHESLGQARYMADHGVLSMLQGDVAVTEILASDNLLSVGLSDFMLESTAGALDVGQIGAGGQTTYKLASDLPAGWTLAGAGDFLGDGHDQILVETTAGGVLVGDVVAAKAVYTVIATLAGGTTLIAGGDFLGALGVDGTPQDDIMIETAAATVFIGQIGSNHKGTYTDIGQFAAGWKVAGTGDYLAKGHDQFLVENATNTVLVGDVENGKVAYTNIATLAAGWSIVGSGAFLGTPGAGDLPKDDFLLQNPTGALFVGEVGAGNKVTYTEITTLPSGWHVVGTGDYLDEGHDQFLIENASGGVLLGDYAGASTHFTLVGDFASQWTFHN